MTFTLLDLETTCKVLAADESYGDKGMQQRHGLL